MRQTSGWKNPLIKEIRNRYPVDSELSAGNFFNIELGLFLWFKVAPNEDCHNFWTLLTGWPFANTWQKLSAHDKKAIAVARYYLRFYKSSRFWKKSLENYLRIPESLRLFNLDEKGILGQRELSICPKRVENYHQVLQEMPAEKDVEQKWAEPGKVYFKTPKEEIDCVEIPNEWKASSENWQFRSKSVTKPFTVTWNELKDTAYWMDESLKTTHYGKQLSEIRFQSVKKQWNFDKGIPLNGLAHLVGMPSAGKSTLMKILTVWASQMNLHTTLIVDNVTAVLELTTLMENLKIEAAPILGVSNRRIHLEKIHSLFHDKGLNLVNTTQLKWLSTICPLDGLRTDRTHKKPFEPGREPCTSLYTIHPWESKTKKPERYFCPLFARCPAHESTRSLLKASVWVATPASLIHTRLPVQLTGQTMRIWEAVYRQSDLLIIDEVDRVQVIFDSYFAPTQVLADSTGKSWLNQLGNYFGPSYYGEGRKQLANSNLQDWLKAYENVQSSINVVYSTFLRNEKLRKWVGRNYFTTWGLMDRFVSNWMNINPQLAGNEIMQKVEAFIKEPFGQNTIREFAHAATLFLIAVDPELGRSLLRSWLDSYGLFSTDEDFVDKLAIIVVFAVLENSLYTMVEEWEEAAKEFKLNDEGLDFFRQRLEDFQ